MNNKRNFCIVAHIDHGKSTLADRFLEVTGTVEKGRMKEQMLDSMDLERERGITIKLQPVHMNYLDSRTGENYELNLIDTPGHVDFNYEVSRSLAAVEGAILLVDATQGIQAQTLANLAIARRHNLTIIPVANKIDLPGAEPERVAFDLADLLNCEPDQVLLASGKTGEGVENIIRRVISDIPAPANDENKPLKAMVFDSHFDSYRGVVAHIRVFEGQLKTGDQLIMMANQQPLVAEEVGFIQIANRPTGELKSGDIGYLVTGLKRLTDCRVGDTITNTAMPAIESLPGYRQPQPMVYASFFGMDGDVNRLRTALEKLTLNDASLTFEPQASEAFGAGFRIGFLGLLHLEITKERIEREFNEEIIVTTPIVAFRGNAQAGYEEPWVKAEIITPPTYIGAVMDLSDRHRGIYKGLHYLGLDGEHEQSNTHATAILEYDLPLADIIIDFNDKLKSATAGYASLSYDLDGYRHGDLVELDILIAGDKIPAFNQLIPREHVVSRGIALTKRLKELIPKQMFEISIQATIGGKIIARETVSAMRKDVTSKLYGGDVTRKNKLLDKQKKGKKKMKQLGRVSVPADVFINALKTDG